MNIYKLGLDKTLTIIHLTLASIYLYLARDLSIGVMKAPGPGLFPQIMGALWFLSSLFVLLTKNHITLAGLDMNTIIRVSKVFCAIIGYFLLIPLAGFSLSTFLILLYVSYVLGNTNWRANTIYSFCGTIIATAIFQWLLQLPLPEPFLEMLDF